MGGPPEQPTAASPYTAGGKPWPLDGSTTAHDALEGACGGNQAGPPVYQANQALNQPVATDRETYFKRRSMAISAVAAYCDVEEALDHNHYGCEGPPPP